MAMQPEFWLAALDTTRFWREDIKEKVEAIYEVVLYDASPIVYIASFQGSYEVYPLYVRVDLKDEFFHTDAEVDDFLDDVDAGWASVESAEYYDESTLDNLPTERKYRIGSSTLSGEESEEEYWDVVEELKEYFTRNQAL